LDMRQCWNRAFRNLKRHEWSLQMFEIPTGPVKWIPETLHPNWLRPPKGRASHSVRAAPAHRTTEKPNH
jgi:hypothetical protein